MPTPENKPSEQIQIPKCSEYLCLFFFNHYLREIGLLINIFSKKIPFLSEFFKDFSEYLNEDNPSIKYREALIGSYDSKKKSQILCLFYLARIVSIHSRVTQPPFSEDELFTHFCRAYTTSLIESPEGLLENFSKEYGELLGTDERKIYQNFIPLETIYFEDTGLRLPKLDTLQISPNSSVPGILHFRASRAIRILERPGKYKICDRGCGSIVAEKVRHCPNCKSFGFEDGRKSVIGMARNLGARESSSPLADDYEL